MHRSATRYIERCHFDFKIFRLWQARDDRDFLNVCEFPFKIYFFKQKYPDYYICFANNILKAVGKNTKIKNFTLPDIYINLIGLQNSH